jgi:hypothetical protein
MLYVIQCEDKPDALQIRLDNRAAHVEYIKQFDIKAAGPTLKDDGETMNGSVIIVDLPDKAAVDEFMSNDPYAQAGLFWNATAHPWKSVIWNSPGE